MLQPCVNDLSVSASLSLSLCVLSLLFSPFFSSPLPCPPLSPPPLPSPPSPHLDSLAVTLENKLLYCVTAALPTVGGANAGLGYDPTKLKHLEAGADNSEAEVIELGSSPWV